MKRILWVLPILATLCGMAGATTRYVAQTAGTFSGGTACNSQTAITPATFNGLTLSAGDTTYLCGTITASSNTTALTISQNGTSGSPISLLFDTGAILQAPYFAQYGNSGSCGGAICIANRSWIVIDGQNTGTIQNETNGSPNGTWGNNNCPGGVACVTQNASGGIEASLTSNITIKNLSIINLYVNVLGDGTLGDSSTVRAINFTGSNWLIQNNVIHDCGWCLADFYSNGDSSVEISQNNIYDFGHAMAIAASAANAITTVKVHDNQIHDTANWGAPGCPFHNDGIHLFGITGSSIDQFFYYNNYNYGNWGTCPTGFVFVEAAGSGTPSNLKTSAWWNNVFIIPSGSPADTSGWFELDQGASGTQTVIGNTFVGDNATDNTLCMQMQGLNSLTYEDNVVSNCGDPIEISSSTLTAVDYNSYGPSCSNGGNCFIHNGSFAGSFSAWKTACACDSHGQQNNTMLLNANGSPQTSSPVIEFGKNLGSLATGSLATFANDTTLGNTRAALARPAATTCTQGTATCPDGGAFQFSAASNATPPAPATGLFADISYLYFLGELNENTR